MQEELSDSITKIHNEDLEKHFILIKCIQEHRQDREKCIYREDTIWF